MGTCLDLARSRRMRFVGGETRHSTLSEFPATVEQDRHGNDKARQDRTSVERVSCADEGGPLTRRKDASGTFPGIDQPDQDDAGVEVFPDFADHFRLGVALAEHFDGEIRRQAWYRLSGA